MEWQEWIEVLLQGSGAAVLGLVAAALTFWLTRRHERARVAGERRDKIVEDVGATAMGVAHSLASWGLWRLQRPTLDFYGAVLRFQAEFGREHPAVCEWLMARTEQLGAAVVRHERWLWFPRSKQRVQAVVDPVLLIALQVTAWGAGQLDDNWFIEALHQQQP